MSEQKPKLEQTFSFAVPDVDQVTRAEIDGETYFLSFGKHPRKPGRFIAIVTKGHPNNGDGHCEVLDIDEVESRKEAASFFGRALIMKPWLPRQ